MNQRKKALLFLLLATLVNLVITIVYFIVFLLLALYFRNYLGNYRGILLLGPLVASVIASFFSYRALLRWANRKWNISQHLDLHR